MRHRRRDVEDRHDRRRRVLREIEDRELNHELRRADNSQADEDDSSVASAGGDVSTDEASS